MKRMLLLWPDFRPRQLAKDVFLVPYSIAKEYSYLASIMYPKTYENSNLSCHYRGVRLIPVKCNRLIFELYSVFYLVFNSRNIDLLMKFHFKDFSLLDIIVYKLINRKGKSYLKMDADLSWVNKANITYKNDNLLKRKLKYCLIKQFAKCVDRISVETYPAYEAIIKYGIYGLYFSKSLVFMPNGFDEESFFKSDIVLNNWSQKENIMISVGRFGTFQKNTELLLEALLKVDFKDWKIYLIGPIEGDKLGSKNPEFEKYIGKLYKNNPNIRDKVIFTGAIYEKKVLWNYFNRAKVMLMSSRYEGSPIVFTEANYFGVYLISTNFDAAQVYAEDGRYGTIVSQEDDIALSYAIQNFIDNKEMLMHKKESISWSSIIRLLDL